LERNDEYTKDDNNRPQRQKNYWRNIRTSNDIIKIKESKREAAIRKGVRQGCNLLPLLFNIYKEQAINECKEYCTGIKVNGVRIQMPRFADDIVIMMQDEINLKRAIESLGDILKSNYIMKVTGKKQKLKFAPKILKILILKWMTS